MYNPFENESAPYMVLINEEEQYSLWPQSIDVPSGWISVFGPGTKDACGQYIEKYWQDMRPKSVRKKMDEVYAK